MKFQSLLFYMSFLFIMSCKEIEIQNGQIPQEYLTRAKTYEGTYVGEFNGKSSEIHLYFRGNQPHLENVNSLSLDILSSQCQSEIGLLKTIFLGDERDTFETGQLEFEFNPGKCTNIMGRRLLIRFINRTTFNAKILSHTELEDECDPRFPPPREGDNCGRIEVPKYYEGTFTKQLN